MDVELLSKMISDLIVDHDSVALPGLGAFFANLVPSSFSDKGYTINPPYRKLSFIQGDYDDNLLVSLYAETNSVDEASARVMILHFIGEMAVALKSRKKITLPGLGRLRATKDNNFFFVPNPDLDIFPEGFGLNAVSLKNIAATEEEFGDFSVDSVPASTLASTPAPTPAPTLTSTLAPTSSQTQTSSPTPSPSQTSSPARRSRWWVWPVSILAAAVAALLIFIILARVAPDFVDTILYSPEELEIINH